MLSLQKRFKHKTHIIWDWNGTLLDDLDLCVAIVAEMRKEHGLPELGRDRHRELFRMPVREFYREMGFDLSQVSFERLAGEFVRRYKLGVGRCSLFRGARELLEALCAEKKRQAILSAASEDHLKELTVHYRIDHVFDHVFGLSDHHAVSKIDRGKELLAHWKADRAQTLLVGDMDHDAEVGKALGIEVLLLADGHQSYSRLRPWHPQTLKCRYED